MTDKPLFSRARDLVATLQEVTDLLAEMRRQQLEMEAYATITRLALGAALRQAGPPTRAAVIARLEDPALHEDQDSPLARAIATEAARMATALRDAP
jgi:hypothetical protein